jgi:hypothetical protein
MDLNLLGSKEIGEFEALGDAFANEILAALDNIEFEFTDEEMVRSMFTRLKKTYCS